MRARSLVLAILGLGVVAAVPACRDYDRLLGIETDMGALPDGGGPDTDGAIPIGGDMGCHPAVTGDPGPTMPAMGPETTIPLATSSGDSATLPVTGVVMGDFTGDAVPDLLVMGQLGPMGPDNPGTTNQFTLLTGNVSGGHRTFTPSSIFFVSEFAAVLAAANVDEAGPDEVITALNDHVYVARVNLGLSTMDVVQSLTFPGFAQTLRAVDVDRDGHLDLIVTYNYGDPGAGPGRLRVYWGRGKTASTPFDSSASGYTEVPGLVTSPTMLEVADLDNDCLPEIVTATPSGYLAVIDVGPGRALTLETLGTPEWQGFFIGMATGDFDGDGADEIFLSENTQNVGTQRLLRAVHRNATSEPRFSVTSVKLGILAVSATAVDVDRNGIKEAVFWYGEGSVGLLRGKPMPSFVPLSATKGSVPWAVAQPPLIADLDLDGKLDLVYGSGDSATLLTHHGQ